MVEIKLRKIRSKLDLLKGLKKDVVIKKERGENILIVGATGSGKLSLMLMVLDSLLINPLRSIMINALNEEWIYESWLLIQERRLGRKVSSFDFIKFNLTEKFEVSEYKKVNFKSKIVQDVINKPTYIGINNMLHSEKANSKLLYRFLKNLPINYGDEIPIFISELSYTVSLNSKFVKEIVKSINNKGYFFVFCGQDFFKIPQDIYKFCVHKIIMKTEYIQKDILGLMSNNISTTLRGLHTSEYCYFKDWCVMEGKVKMDVDIPKKTEELPVPIAIRQLMLKSNILGF